MTTASVIVPSYAGAERLPRLLSALAEQSQTELEIIIVLDGVVDHSEHVLDDVAVPVRRVVLPENRGRSAALNAGFRLATGEVLIRCDDDLEPPIDWARAHVSAHERGVLGVVGLCPNVYSPSPYARAYGYGADARFRADAYRAPAGDRWRYWGGNVSVTRDVFDRVGEYSTDYRAYGWEDVDWGYRLHRLGVGIELDPGAEARHHGASTATAIRSRRAYLSGAARRTFERRHGAQADPRPPGVWGSAVRALARIENEPRLARISTFVDLALPAMPPRVGEKFVALVVESAARAGYDRAPDRANG